MQGSGGAWFWRGRRERTGWRRRCGLRAPRVLGCQLGKPLPELCVLRFQLHDPLTETVNLSWRAWRLPGGNLSLYGSQHLGFGLPAHDAQAGGSAQWKGRRINRRLDRWMTPQMANSDPSSIGRFRNAVPSSGFADPASGTASLFLRHLTRNARSRDGER